MVAKGYLSTKNKLKFSIAVLTLCMSSVGVGVCIYFSIPGIVCAIATLVALVSALYLLIGFNKKSHVADGNKASTSGSSIENTQENKGNSTDELGDNGKINGTGVEESPVINGSNVQQSVPPPPPPMEGLKKREEENSKANLKNGNSSISSTVAPKNGAVQNSKTSIKSGKGPQLGVTVYQLEQATSKLEHVHKPDVEVKKQQTSSNNMANVLRKNITESSSDDLDDGTTPCSDDWDDDSSVSESDISLVADSNKASASGSSIKDTQENTGELGGNGNINGTGVKEGPFINGFNVQQGGSTQEINTVHQKTSKSGGGPQPSVTGGTVGGTGSCSAGGLTSHVIYDEVIKDALFKIRSGMRLDDDNDDTISHGSNDDCDMTLQSSYNTTSQASSSISVPSAHPIKDVKEKVVCTSKANSSNLDDNSPVLGSGTNLVADSNKENSTDELGGNGNINGTGVKEGPFINDSNVQQGGSTQEINKVRSPLGQINNIQNNSRSNGNVMKIARIFDTSIFYGYLPPK